MTPVGVSERWHKASGETISLLEIITIIEDHTEDGGKVYVGCDSQLGINQCTFATAICLHGGEKRTSTYFFLKDRTENKSMKDLRVRIDAEVSRALDATFIIMEAVPSARLEMHVDIGRTVRSKTRKYVDSILGWVRGSGVPCKIKPEAWASASVADRHTK